VFGDVLDGVRDAVTPTEPGALGPLPDGASPDPRRERELRNHLPPLGQHYRSDRSALYTPVESSGAERSALDAVEYLQVQRNARATSRMARAVRAMASRVRSSASAP
jgi:hypothetical protein